MKSAKTGGSQQHTTTFEFKMCKKVAELTQIIHAMFMKTTEFEIRQKLMINSFENEIKSIINEYQNRENDLIEKHKIVIEALDERIKYRDKIIKEHERNQIATTTTTNHDKKECNDFSCQVSINFDLDNSFNIDTDRKLTLDEEKMRIINNRLRSKIIKLETKILSERFLNSKLINKIKNTENNSRLKHSDSHRGSITNDGSLSKKNSFTKITSRKFQRENSIEDNKNESLQSNSRLKHRGSLHNTRDFESTFSELNSTRSFMVHSVSPEFVVLKEKFKKVNKSTEKQNEEENTTSRSNLNETRNVQLHSKLLKFPDLKEYKK